MLLLSYRQLMWSQENGLRFSTANTVAMHFCRRRCSDPDLGIWLYGETIPTQPVARFLGVLFDRRLRYVDHFKTLQDRCFRALNVLKCVARTSYGADRSTLSLLYRATIRSKLDYACFVYDCASESNKRLLDTVHHTALRVATGEFRTSPKSSLLAKTHEPPSLAAEAGAWNALRSESPPVPNASNLSLCVFEGFASALRQETPEVSPILYKNERPLWEV